MNVTVKLFAVAKQLAAADLVHLELPTGATVADIRRELVKRLPRLDQFGRQLRFAVNADYADDTMTIPAGAEVACIPPVSGG